MSRIAGVGNSTNIFDGQKRDFIVMRKDTFEYIGTYQYVTSDGIDAEYDFTGCIGAMMIKKKKADTVPVRVVSVYFNITEYTLFVDAEDMDMDAGKYYYDMQIKDADGKFVTKMYGDFIVLQDVTDFLSPHDEEIVLALTNEIGVEKMETLKSILSLSNEITYIKGMGEKSAGIIKSEISHSVQPNNKSTMVISNEIVYQLMTYWFAQTGIITSEISYLQTLSYNELGAITSTLTWIVLEID